MRGRATSLEKNDGIDTATPSLGSGPGVALQTGNGEVNKPFGRCQGQRSSPANFVEYCPMVRDFFQVAAFWDPA